MESGRALNASDILRAQLEQSGGQIPSFRPRFTVDVTALPDDQREALAHLLDQAGVLDESTRPVGTAAPGALRYELTLHTAGETHRVSFHDQSSGPSLDALADWIRRHGTPP